MTISPYKLLFWICFVFAIPQLHAQPGKSIDFNKGWKFFLGNDSLAILESYNDKSWRQLDVPHDWSIEQEFDEQSPATTQGGALNGGVGWYRKEFSLPPVVNKKRIWIEFDGVYCNSEVWINGHYVGKRPNGYISFQYDITPFVKAGKGNLVAVKVDNSKQPNSRWYTGSGIYRNVRLRIAEEISIAPWGIFLTTSGPEKNKARIYIATTIQSHKTSLTKTLVYTDLYDVSGRMIYSGKKNAKSVSMRKGDTEVYDSILLNQPRLWSIKDPYLYTAVTRVMMDGKLIDERKTRFGIRNFYFDADKGFYLNGQPLKILGVCNHHDLGALGAAVNKSAIERQLKILKSMGVNAIRTAHNPPAPELLDLCDEMGFLVMDEAFDMWKKKKNKYDYYSEFEQWHKRDIEDMVKRDRNHPSIFMWSIGNEIREQFDSSGITITRELVDIIKALDTTRPVTSALSEWNPEKNYIYKSGALDIIGLNYHHEVYVEFPKYFPGQKFIGTENMSALETRGHYDFPADSIYFWPARSPQKVVEKGNNDFTVSAFDQVAAYWGSTHETTWKIIKKYDFLSGLFVWTGFDYLGEPTPYPWPARSSYFGIIDLAGFPKDVYYMYKSEWTKEPVLHVFPHWNWEAGKMVDIWSYYNNADEVELFLNGRSLGTRKKTGDDLHVSWKVMYEPGVLKAISRKNGKAVLSKEIRTASSPYRIELSTDKKVLKAGGEGLAFITARVLDKMGNPVPYADNLINFSISGGSIVGTDNGYQADLTLFASTSRKAWKGLLLAIVKPGKKQGNITLKATSASLISSEIVLKAVE